MGTQLLSSPFFVGEAAAAELSEIRDRGYLIVAVKNNRAPLGFVDASGNLSGFEIDIARRLAAEILGDESAVRLVPTRNEERLNAVIADEVDMAIAAITITASRRRIVNFSDPYYLDGTAFITNQPEIQGLRDLRISTVALINRSSAVAHVRYILPGAQLVGVSSYAEGQSLLQNGTVDAFAGDASVLTGWTIEPGAQPYRLLPSILSAEPLSVALPKGVRYTPLQEAVNQALRRWYEEGWLQERAAYWGLPAETAQFIDLSPAN
ncbi:MAG: transporter substrate-binding domain-containing protein [Phormidesmis sp.]